MPSGNSTAGAGQRGGRGRLYSDLVADIGPVDVLEVGPGPDRPDRRLVWFTVAALLIGAVVGYLVGSRHPAGSAPGRTAASVTPSAQAPSEARPLEATGRRCAAQRGDQLPLGIEVRNTTATTVGLIGVDPTLPLGGLQAAKRTLGSCGQLSSDPTEEVLVTHGTGWVSITFDVQMTCPAPLPVSFAVLYESNGARAAVELPGFVDLGDVPYSHCPAGS